MSDASHGDSLAISLFGEIMATEQLLRIRFSKALPKGMELSQFSVLNHLCGIDGERKPAQLARLFQLTKGAMTNTLGKLEAAGYIHIRPDWDDARRKLVSISDAGREARQTAVVAIKPLFDEIMDEVGAENIRAALPFLRDLRAALKSQ